jgi:hypothetical protein
VSVLCATGAAILQTIVPVLEANKRRGAEAGDEDEDDEVDNDDEVEEEMGGEVEDKAGEKDVELGETVEVAGASSDAAAAQTIDSWVCWCYAFYLRMNSLILSK